MEMGGFLPKDHVDSAQRPGTRDHLRHRSTTPGLHGGQDLPGSKRTAEMVMGL